MFMLAVKWAALAWMTLPHAVSPFSIGIGVRVLATSTPTSKQFRSPPLFESKSKDVDESLGIDHFRSMSVKELKAELTRRGVSTSTFVEKEQMVVAAWEARNKPTKDVEKSAATPSQRKASNNAADFITAPLFFTDLEAVNVAAVNMDGGIAINKSEKPFITVKIEARHGSSVFPLNLLLDTACSGVVLRPSVADENRLPNLSSPGAVSMTGAGGTSSAGARLSQLSSFTIGDSAKPFGPLPVAVQDVSALPSSIDGILGLSFLSQFACVEMDFEKGEMKLYDQNPSGDEDLIVADGSMTLLPLGVYAVDVWLGPRGPVKMLVDTGAASTFLNWKGVESLGVAKNDRSFLHRLNSPTGAMGSDNVAMTLTHRIFVSSSLGLGAKQPQVSLALDKESRRLAIDIGVIVILDQMESFGVGGILGIDSLVRSSRIRLFFRGRLSPRLQFLDHRPFRI